MKVLFYFALLFIREFSSLSYHKNTSTVMLPPKVAEGRPEFWNMKAQNYIRSKIYDEPNLNKAKNIIFFIGDGMGFPIVAATRVYQSGKEEADLSFDRFPHFGLSKTYCVNLQTAESACAAVAFFSGVKTNDGVLGFNANVVRDQCKVNDDDRVESILSWAQKAGKATGFVTTTRVTHATPAGLYAHTSSRGWENNDHIVKACGEGGSNVKDSTHQLLNNKAGKNLNVVLGCGRKNFINATQVDEEDRPGKRTDGRDLIEEWLNDHNRMGDAEYIWHKHQLNDIDHDKTDYLLGLFESDHCMYNLDIINNNLQDQEPSLTDMTVAAIKVLQKNEKGFFLFVEGGNIDKSSHASKVAVALEETKEFARAVEFARQMTDEADTLVIVSSDHSHTLSYSGYANRGEDILGAPELSDIDGMPYETLSFANGPSYYSTYANNSNRRVDITNQDLTDPDRRPSSTAPLTSETHGGEDVGVYASGPMAHIFVGHYEQNVIPFLIASAAQIGPYEQSQDQTDSALSLSTSFYCFIAFFLSFWLM